MGLRKCKNTHDLYLLNAKGIVRESAAILVQNFSALTGIAVPLISPVSAALLVFPHTQIATKFALQIRDSAHAAGLSNWVYSHLIFQKISETLVSFLLCFPLLITFSLLARASVSLTVASIYAGEHRPSREQQFQGISKLWKRLVVTYLWACVLIIGANALILVLMAAFLKLVCVLGLGFVWEFGALLGGGIVYSIVFAHLMIVSNLATIVCVMEEDSCGIRAVFKAMFFMRGKTRIALVMAVVVNLSWAFVERLFVYGVMRGSGGNTRFDGLLLVWMYSMVAVIDTVMMTVFYFTCRSSCLESGGCLL